MLPPVANRFVAGEGAPEAIDHVIGLNDRGIGGILNVLGEHYSDRSDVVEDTDTYLQLVDDIDRGGLDAAISVKPTQLGLDIGDSLFVEQLARIIERARKRDVFVWIDMEGSGTTEATISAFEAMVDRHPHGVGICLQANLHRTADDRSRLAGLPGRIRLVKGAYREPPSIAYRDVEEVNAAFRELLEVLVRDHSGGTAVASHDSAMVAYAEQLAEVHGGELEFQFLMGVRSDLRDSLVGTHRVNEYVPFGPRWRSYFARRVLERTENLKFAIRAILG